MTAGAALALAGLAALGLAAPLAEARRSPVTDAERAKAPGESVSLSRGTTYLRRFGPARGPVALCLHGLATPGYVWTPVAEALALAGYRVIVPDLFGRGLSDRPGGAQDSRFFIAQVEELCDRLDLGADLTLLGYSMGGAVATAFAHAHPARVRRLVLIAPAGLGVELGRFADFCTHAPLVGDWAMRVFGGMVQRRAIDRSLPRHPSIPDIAIRQAAETRRRGSLPATLSAQRHVLREDLTATHRSLGASALPILAIWGEHDRIIPKSALGRMAQANRAVQHVVVAGAGHSLPWTHLREVMDAFLAFQRIGQ